MKTSKYLYMFLGTNLVFWIFSVVMTSYTAWYIAEKPLADVKMVVVAYLFLSLGFMTFFIGFVGCCGGARISMFFLKLYVGVMLIFFLAEVFTIIYLCAGSLEVLDGSLYVTYWMALPIGTRIDLQSTYGCCGVTGFSDYIDRGVSPDIGCYRADEANGIVTYNAYENGCDSHIFEPLETAVAVNSSLLLLVFTVQLLGLFTDVKLIKRIKRQRERMASDRRVREEKNRKKKEDKERKRRLRVKEDQRSLIGVNTSSGDLSSRGDDEFDRVSTPEDPSASRADLVVHSQNQPDMTDSVPEVEIRTTPPTEDSTDYLGLGEGVRPSEDGVQVVGPADDDGEFPVPSTPEEGQEGREGTDNATDEGTDELDGGLLSPKPPNDDASLASPSPTPSDSKV